MTSDVLDAVGPAERRVVCQTKQRQPIFTADVETAVLGEAVALDGRRRWWAAGARLMRRRLWPPHDAVVFSVSVV